MDDPIEAMRRTRKKRMLVLEEIATEAEKSEGPPGQASASASGGGEASDGAPGKVLRRTGSNTSQATRSFRRTAGAVSKANLAIKAHRSFQQRPEELRSIKDSLLYKMLRPLFITMAVTGIFFVKTHGEPSLFQRAMTSLTGRRWGAAQVYCIAMFSLLSLNFLRSLGIFDPDDGFNYSFFFKLLWVMQWYHCASRAMLFTHLCWPRKKNSLTDLFFKIEKICYPDGIVPYEQPLRSMLCYFVAFFSLYVVANVAIPAYGFFAPGDDWELFRDLLLPIPKWVPYFVVWKGFVLFAVFMSVFVGTLTMFVYFIMCYIFYKEFEYFCRTFCMKIRSDGVFTDDLEKFRIMHQKRCKLVEDADTLFKYYIANHYLVTVTLLCLMLFNIAYSEKEGFQLGMAAMYCVFVAFEMIFVSIVATLVNTEAHTPLVYIHSVHATVETPEDMLVMNMFLNRLTGTQIGMTAWDMFVINKPAILTVAGFIATYFFLMVQLKTPVLGDVKCLCRYLTDDNFIVTQFEYIMDISIEKICYPDGIIPYDQTLITTMRYFAIFFTFYVLVNVGVPAYGLFAPGHETNLFSSLLFPIPLDMPYVEVWKGVVLFFITMTTVVCVLTMFLYFVMCYLFYKEFEYFCRTFSMKIRSDGVFTDDLEKFRAMHQKRCKLVEDTDTLFKYYIANHYLVTVVLLCLLLFNIVFSEKDQFELLVSGLSLAFIGFEVMFVSLTAILVNSQAHAPLAYIHSVRAHVSTPEDMLIMNMFMSRLTGTQIGMTAWDMFVINKPAILTVAGFILTYFFLMVQLKAPVLGEVKCMCDLATQNGLFHYVEDFIVDPFL